LHVAASRDAAIAGHDDRVDGLRAVTRLGGTRARIEADAAARDDDDRNDDEATHTRLSPETANRGELPRRGSSFALVY
jgi:hypothetical protein